MQDFIHKLLQLIGYDLYRYPDGCERLIPHLKRLLTAYRINGVIDVGANVGQFALNMRSLAPDIEIHSFEPNPYVYNTLAANAARDKRWVTHACALGQSHGKIVLNITASSDFSSCRVANEFGARQFNDSLSVTEAIEVEMRTLDEVLDGISAEIKNSLLVKLDTQGFDMQVLQGATKGLKNAKIIVTEASLQPIYEGAALLPEVLEFMTSRGFTLSGFFPVTRSNNLGVIESDCVFVRGQMA